MTSKFLSIIFLAFWSGASYAALITFQSGQIAKAEDFNNNFTDLDSRIQNLEISDSYVTAQVNGVDMKVISNYVGNYSIITPTGLSISIDAEGYPRGSLYYEASDCSGQPYINFNNLHTNKQVGYTYPNPLINTTISISYDGTNAYYSVADNIVKLNYKSYSYTGNSGTTCYNSPGTTLAGIALANNPNITGINSFPLIITGVGSVLSISQEIGVTSASGSAGGNVYANGALIGVTARIPYSADQPISVKLNNYNNKTINLYKDGTYTGFANATATLYYLTNDCTGNAYVRVLNDYSKEWWTGSLTTSGTVSHNGNYYSLSNEIYKISAGAQSSSPSYNGTCSPGSFTNQDGYKKATLNSSFPVFTPPITIDGWSEDTQYDVLPEAY